MNPYIENTKIYNLFNIIKETNELQCLLVEDKKVRYICDEEISSKNFSHLHKCVMNTNKYRFLNEYIDEYLNLNPDQIDVQNKKGYTALILASANSKTYSTEETVEILLKHNANLNIQDFPLGWTALIHSCSYLIMNSTEKTVELLIKHGADVNIQGKTGRTALSYTINIFNNPIPIRIRIIKMLLDNKADVNIVDKHKKSALHNATQLNNDDNYQIVKLLLDNNADVDLQNMYGKTALINSVLNYKKQENTIRILLEYGANIYLRNCNGHNSILYAFYSNLSNDGKSALDILLPNRRIFIKNVIEYQNKIKYYWYVGCCDYKIKFKIFESFHELIRFM